MVAGRPAGGTHISDDLALGYRIPLIDNSPAAHMPIEGGIAVAVGNLDIVAVNAVIPHVSDHTALGRVDFRTAGCGDVVAGVVAPFAGDRVLTWGKRRRDIVASRQRPVPFAVVRLERRKLFLILLFRRGQLVVQLVRGRLIAVQLFLIVSLQRRDLGDQCLYFRLLLQQFGLVDFLLSL